MTTVKVTGVELAGWLVVVVLDQEGEGGSHNCIRLEGALVQFRHHSCGALLSIINFRHPIPMPHSGSSVAATEGTSRMHVVGGVWPVWLTGWLAWGKSTKEGTISMRAERSDGLVLFERK